MVLARELEVVANNIANLNTNGFKADESIFQEYIMPVARQNHFPGATDRQLSHVIDVGTWRNMGQGAVERTGNPLDIAIDGNAFLTVQTPNGVRYTRDGSLKINSTGQLVTSDGYQLQGENGPITFQQTDHDISIAPDGRITVIEGANNRTETTRGRLAMVTFAQPQQLQKDGNNNFVAPAGVAANPATNARLMQGYVEKSNVSGVVEMSRLIEITRSYAEVANLLQQQGDLHKTAIQQLAEIPT
jgi:flagellar basal-body rod protein FlgF/flagellar basal-body rod protein FlgG